MVVCMVYWVCSRLQVVCMVCLSTNMVCCCYCVSSDVIVSRLLTCVLSDAWRGRTPGLQCEVCPAESGVCEGEGVRALPERPRLLLL